MTATLTAAVAEEAARPVPEPAPALAAALRARHGAAVAAVVFYGSCLRRGADAATDGVYDFYVVVDRYRDAYAGRLAAAANALLPPNVFFVELPWRGRTLRVKYAVISLAQLRRGTSPRSLQPMLWARFAQPVRIVHARDPAAREAVVDCLAAAVATTVGRVVPLMDETFDAAGLWTRAFRETYRAELRVEPAGQARALYEADPARYAQILPAALEANGIAWSDAPGGGRITVTGGVSRRTRRWARPAWAVRRAWGRTANALRLIKAAFTYEGAVAYVLWKIERHSGVRATATPWQRRHPLLALPVLAWRLYRRGAFRPRA